MNATIEAITARRHEPGRVVSLEVDLIDPHPNQARLFGDPAEDVVKALAADIKAYGLKSAVEVVPNPSEPGRYVLVGGHHRLTAVKSLGRDRIDAVVRHDLAGDPAAIDRCHAGDNLLRKNLSDLQKLRCYCAALDADRRAAEAAGEDPFGTPFLRRAAAAFGMGEKNARRYRDLAFGPAAVRRAAESGDLGLAAAEQALRSGRAEEIAAEIDRRGVREAKRIVAGLLKPRRSVAGDRPDAAAEVLPRPVYVSVEAGWDAPADPYAAILATAKRLAAFAGEIKQSDIDIRRTAADAERDSEIFYEAIGVLTGVNMRVRRIAGG